MAKSLCFPFLCAFQPTNKPGLIIGNSTSRDGLMNNVTQNCKNAKFQLLEAKATGGNQSTKQNSIVCAECEGNGAISCKQCEGSGVNSVDHFNGQFKAGGLCWLCRGKREILCGSCNGAGYIGGFMNTFED